MIEYISKTTYTFLIKMKFQIQFMKVTTAQTNPYIFKSKLKNEKCMSNKSLQLALPNYIYIYKIYFTKHLLQHINPYMF
jgi:hypothetical protein